MPQKPATNTRGKSKVSTKWLNNVMKSIGAASVDNFKEIAPNLSELGKGTAGAIRSIKDVTTGNNVSQVSKALSNNSTIKSVKKAFTNSLNDIKTGKIYNNERLTETMEESFGDFDFSDFEDANEDATVTFNYIDDGNRSSSNGSAVIADAIATSAESNIKAQKASVDAMISIASAGMMQSQEIAKETNMHLSNINNGITALVQFQQENTLKFYESAMAVFDRYAKTTEDADRGKRSNGPDVFNGTRGIDAGKYKEYVKKQIKSVYKNSGAGSTLDMLTDDSMLDMMLANPVGGATKMILSAMVPNLVTNTVKGMEDAFTGFMPTMLAKLGDWRKSEEAGMKGALQRLIGNVFGIKVDAKKGFDLSGKVSKDAAIFDGVTRNSIVEIIPKHLREMSSYLKDIAEHFKIDTNKSKDNGEVFDIESGRYTKVKDVRSDIANQIKEGIEDAFNHSEFGEALRAGGSELVGKDAKTYEKMMSQFFQGLTRYEKAFTPDKMDIHDKNSDINKIAEYIDVNNKHDEKILNILLNTIDLMKKNQVGVQHAAKAQMDAKVAFNNAIEDLNENYDTRNLLAAGITEDTNPWELVDVETGNKNSQRKRKERQEREKREQKARDKYQMKHRTKGNAKTLAKKGLQSQDIIPDNETMSGRRKSAVKMADASTIPGMIANVGTHTKNGMFAIMNGDSKGAMKEFAAIFSDSMKTFWGSIKDNFLNPLKESIFGKKDENGYKQGGMFSAIQNKSKDIWHEMGSKIKGTDWIDADGNVHKGDKENSVLGKVSSVFKEVSESVRYRLFGDKDKDGDGAEKKTGVIGGLVESLKLGLQGWKTTLFGSDDPEKSEKDMIEDFKKKAMDAIPSLGVGALAGLGTSVLSGGLLGAIVGGPMTGIVLGMGTSLIARSNKFKDYLFGPEVEDENGNKSRIGGLVSKKTQEMFKDPKLKRSVIGGAALGMAKNLILGSSGGFMGALVGGPFAGAILGSAVGFMKESQMFKDFMYGNEEKGIEGFKSKLSNNIKKAFDNKDEKETKDFKKRLGMGVIGAGTGGLLGFMAGGPIVGALAGLALGVKSSGKKFNQWLFGEKDENGKKIKEGMVGKVGNWMHVEVFAPMKTKFLGIADDFKNTMKNKVFAKLSVMVEPLVGAFKKLTDKIKERTKKAGGLIKKIMSPITNLAKKIVFDPLKKVVSGVTSLAYKSAKSLITFPVKILEVATRWVTSPFRKAAKKVGEAVDNVKEFTKATIKKAYSNTFGKLVNLVKAGFSWGKDKAKEKVSNTGYKILDTISGGRIKGKEGLNNLKKKLGFGGVGTSLTDADIAYMKEKQENKKVQRDRKAMDKNRALAAKTLGYDVKYFDEKTMNAAIEKNKALKHKFKKNSAGEIGFEKDPKQVAAEMKQKAAETVQKLSDDDMLNAKSSDLDIQGRQLQQQTRSASLLERLVSFFTGDKPAFGVGKMNQSGKSDSYAEKDEKDKKDSEDKDNENEDEESGAISKIDELKQKFEEAGGFINYIKGKASETFANFKEKSKNAIGKVKGFFNRKGKARANGGDVNDGESYLVGDGGSDPSAAEIFTPKAKGKILSQKGNGIKVFVQGIASSVISKLKGTDGPSIDGATPSFGGGINGIKGRLKNFGMGIPFVGGSNNSSEDDSEADDIAVMKTKANSDADYDEEGNLIKENADTSDVDDIKDSSAKKEAIIDADNAADLANAKNEGSFESQQKKKEAEKEGEKDKEYKGLFSAIKDKIGEGNEQSKSHFLSWDNIFSKKGLITAGLLVLMAKFPGIWNTLKDIIGSIADGIGTMIGRTADQADANNGVGSQTDGKSIPKAIIDNVKDVPTNPLGLDEDGSSTNSTHSRVNLGAKMWLNWKNRHKGSLTKGTKKVKKVMRGAEKVIKAPGKALDYIVNGPASDYKKFTRDKTKNGLKFDKKTGVYTDKYNRIVIDKDEWKQMVDEKGEDWAAEFKDHFYAPGDDSFELDPGKKESKVSKWKNKKKKQIKTKVKNSKAGKKFDAIKTKGHNKVEGIRNKAKTKVKNSKVGKGYDKVKNAKNNAKKQGKEFLETIKTEAKTKVAKGGEKIKNAAQQAANSLKNKATKNKADGGLFKKVAGYVEDFFGSLIKKLTEKSGKSGGGIKKALSKFSPKNIMNALKSRFPKISAKLSAVITRGVTLGGATLGISELVFAVGGAIDGATCASKLFMVAKEDTDWIMRLIGAAWGLAAGTTAGAVIDCILDFLEPLNVRVGILSALYSFFAGSDKADKLTKAQKKFQKTYEADTNEKIKAQWETQKKAGIIGKDVSYEEFQEGVKEGKYKIDQESINDYNARVNAGLGDKITGGITKGAGYLYHRGKDFLVGKESYQDDKGNTYSKNDDGSWQVTDKSGKDLGYVNKDAIDTSKMKNTSSKGVIGKGKELIGGAINKGKELVGGAINKGKELIGGAVSGIKNFFFGSDDSEKAAKVDKKSGGVVGAAMDMGKTVVNAVKNPRETMMKISNGVHNFFTSEKEDIYRNPKDNSYYRANGKNWDLYNANGQKVNKKPIPAADVIAAFQAGTLIKDTLTTRESGISKTIGAVKKGLNAAKDKVVGAAKAGWNGIKKVGSWVWEHAKNNAKTLIGGVKKAGTAVKNFFMDSKEEIFRANDGTYYNAKGECFSGNDERLKNQDISPKELQARIKAGTLIKTEKVKKSGIKNLASKAWNGVKNGVKKGWNALKNFGTSVRDKAMDMGKTFVNGVKKAGTAVKNFFMDSKEEIFRASDGTYYNAKGECFNKNDERLKNQDISPKELQARIKAGTLVKQQKVKKSGIKNLASKAWNGLTGGIKKGWNALKNFGTSVRDKAMDMGKTFVNGVKNAAEKTKNFFMDSKESVFVAADGTYYNAKGECFNKNDERLKNQDISPKELQARIKAGTLVKKEKVKKSGIKNLASKAWNGLTSGIKKGWEGLKSFAGGVKEKFGELKDGFVKFAKDPLGSVKSFFTSSKKQGYMSPEGDYYILNDDKTWTHYSATGGVLEDNIKDKEKIKEINSKIKNGTLIQTEITDKSGLQKIGEKFQNAVSKGWDKIKDGASSLWSGITNFFGGGGDEVSNTAAKVTKQTDAIVPPAVKDAAKKSMANQKKTGGNGENEDDENGGNGEEVNGFSYFSQKDKKWSGNKYGSKDGKHSSSFGKSGCGPTAFAMVANQLKGGKIDPTTIADDAIKSGYRDETGTNANFIDYESQKYGLDTTQQDSPSAEYIIGQMDKGRPMILNGITSGSKDSAYTKSGHYVVAVGRDKNGNILINDPRGKSKSVPISPEDLAKETRIGWTFESPGYTIKKITKRIGGHGDKNTFTAEDVINIAKGEVGYSEKASNSKLDDKKANAGKKNFTKYARDVGHANGLAWCATFVTWCFVKAANGDKKKAKEVLCGANTAGCSNNVNAFKKAGRYDMKPQPGDVVFFMNGSSHTGLVIAVKGNTITTIEGNTSPGKFNRDGGCVAQKTYNYKTYHRISGFGHPKYDGTSTFNGEVGTADSSSDSNSSTTESSSDNAITSFSDKFTNLFTQFSEKAMNGITTGKWDYNFNADGNTTDSSSSDNDTSDNTSGTSDGKIDTSISGNNESEQVWNFFTNNGFSPAATAGILGNMYQESGVNPKSIQGNGKGPAAGIFQWENYNNSKGTRFGGLLKKAKKRNKSWKDIGVQLEYALGEMQSADLNKRFAGKIGYLQHNPWTTTDIDKKRYSVKPVKGGFEGYKKMTDPTEATKVFEAAFERAGKPNFKRRIAYAKKMMNKYGDKVGGNGEGEGTDTYLNETSERYFNPQYKKTNTFDVNRTVHVNTTNKSGNNIMNVIDTKKLEEILEKAVSVLESIDKSTSSSQKELQNLRNASNNQMNNVTNNNIYNTSNQSGTTVTGKNINDRNSKLAAMLARG